MKSKRMRDLPPDMSVGEAARRVLSAHCRAVRRLLPLAAERADEDVEHVHQLRVATRRASAAATVFRPWLRDALRRKLNRQLRRIRRAAADARDGDVLLAVLSSTEPVTDADEQAAADLVVRYVQRRRAKAQKAVVATAKKYSSEELRRTERRLQDSGIRRGALGSDAPVLSQWGAETLPPLLAALQEAADADLADMESLHELRLAGKRLRYAMEVFVSCYPPEFRQQFYTQVERMQELLGAVNDGYQMTRLIERAAKSAGRLRQAGDPGVKRLRRALARLSERCAAHTQDRRETFLAWCSDIDAKACFAALKQQMLTGPLSARVPSGDAAPDANVTASSPALGASS